MGHNIDMREFGLCNIKCSVCNNDLSEELSELDMDCDLKSHNPNCFELNVQCFNCHHNNEIKFEIYILEKE